MIKFYDITEDELNGKVYKPGSLYFCHDTLNIYLDSIPEGKRICMTEAMIILDSEDDRINMITMLPYKLYFVKDSGKTYIHNGIQWIDTNPIIQPDWNQNDENASDYIKNRIAYTDIEKKILLPETTIEFTEDINFEYAIETELNLEVGKECTVIWDGTNYTRKVCIFEDSENGDSLVYIGNGSIVGAEDTGEPFIIGLIGGFCAVAYIPQIESSHTFAIESDEEVTHKIDPKYYDRLAWVDNKVVEILPETTITIIDSACDLGVALDLYTANGCTVIWDGVNYVFDKINYEIFADLGVTFAYVGNTMMIPEEASMPIERIDTGEPFIIMALDNLDTSGVFATVADTDELNTHTINVYAHIEDVNKIDPKFYDRLAWEENNIEAVMPEQCLDFVNSELVLDHMINMHAGKKYEVIWDGVSYICEAIFYEDLNVPNVYIGNIGLFIDGYTNTGEPFIIFTSFSEGTSVLLDLSEVPDGDQITTSHTISITLHDNVIHKIDPKFYDRLAWSENIEEEVLPEITVDFSDLEYSLYEFEDKLKIELGKEYIVLWDNKEYICKAYIEKYMNATFTALGNAAIASTSLEDTGEPFIIGSNSNDMAIMTHSEETQVHSISIRCKSEIVHKINPKFYDRLAWSEVTENGALIVSDLTVELNENNSYQYASEECLGLERGKIYTVLWDNVQYTCKAKYAGGVYVYIGNAGLLGGESTGIEPFIIMDSKNDNMTMISDILNMNDQTVERSHIVSIRLEDTETIHKIDPKYYDRIGYIEYGEDREVMAETTITFDENEYALALDMVSFLELGKSFTVNWDGIQYKCICNEFGFEEDVIDFIFIGNIGIMLPEIAAIGEEPFLIITNPNEGGLYVYCLSCGLVNSTIPQHNHNISITLNEEIVHKIDPKYYDPIAYTEYNDYKELLPETVVSGQMEIDKIGFEPNKTYTVTINGESGEIDSVVSTELLGTEHYCIGLTSSIGIIVDVYLINGGEYIGSIISSNIGECTISITQGTKIIHKIDPKYIPDECFGGGVDEEEVKAYVNEALFDAKISGEFDGMDGANGMDGYTPVKGVDYWTEEDKDEIKAYVDEAILGGAW